MEIMTTVTTMIMTTTEDWRIAAHRIWAGQDGRKHLYAAIGGVMSSTASVARDLFARWHPQGHMVAERRQQTRPSL